MAKSQIVQDLADILDDHHAAWVVGCECMPVCEETGVQDVLGEPWSEHIATIALDFIKGKLSE